MMLGFAGLGLMGEPMARNLIRAGMSVTLYNRSPEKAHAVAALGADVVDSPDALFARCDTVILMLADDGAVDAVLGRGSSAFVRRIADRLIINMGTHRPAWSQALEADVRAAGGSFVEAPVSGSRLPAETGTLVAMLAGDEKAVERARPLLAPMCSDVLTLGTVPSAMAMKMAVNLYLMATVAALAEAANLAATLGLDLDRFRSVITNGQLGSGVARAKLDKIVARDFLAQASIRDVCKNAELVAATAADAGAAAPILAESRRRFEMARAAGGGTLDMAAVVSSFTPAGALLLPELG